MKKFSLILLSALMLASTSAKAVVYAVDVTFDKKIINVDSLRLASSTSIITVLKLLPELLERPGESFINNYNIEIEDMAVGSLSDATLRHLKIADVQKIEVSKSPISSYQNNGQGGSINIILRSSEKADANKQTWGSIAETATYGNDMTDIMPHLQITHKYKNWIMRGLAMGEVYNYNINTTTSGSSNYETLSKTRSQQQMARFYAWYSPTAQDQLKLNISEDSYTQEPETQVTTDGVRAFTTHENTHFNIHTFINYCHKYNKYSKFEAELQYKYTPENEVMEKSSLGLDYDSKNHNLSGKVEYRKNLLPADLANDYSHITVGVSGNAVWGSYAMEDYAPANILSRDRLEANANTFFFKPYLTYETILGEFKIKAKAELQYFKYDVSAGKMWSKTTENVDMYNIKTDRWDFTGIATFGWQFTEHQQLRFIADRKLNRPSNAQIYPYLVFSPEQQRYVKGSTDLIPTLSHEFSLDYITDLTWGEHSLTLNAGASYNYVKDIITDVTMGKSQGGGGFGQMLEYLTYINNGNNNILSGNLMALYGYKNFSVSCSGNIYRNHKEVKSIEDDYNYFNISILPSIKLPKDWTATAGAFFYSKVETNKSKLGGSSVGFIDICKHWGNFYANLSSTFSLSGKTENVFYNADGTAYANRYLAVPLNFTLGVAYRF